jgi:predicted Zn finger-like uncharacterized protein
MPAIQCPDCSARIRIKESDAGRTVRCPRCGQALTIPFAPREFPQPEITVAPAEALEINVEPVPVADPGPGPARQRKKSGSPPEEGQGLLKAGIGLGVAVGIMLWCCGALYQPQTGSRTEPPSPDKKWYSGGTLTRGTMRDWRNATPENKLASAADMSLALLRQDGRDVSSISIDGELRAAAEDLVKGLDKVSEEPSALGQSVAEVVTAIYFLQGRRPKR